MTRSRSRQRLDRFLAALARFILRIFFREIEVVGLDKMPDNEPLLIVSNHGNGLVDGMLVAGFVPRPSRFLGKSTLWSHPVVKYLVRLAGAIPVYRRQDEGVDTSQNARTFERCHEELAAGGAIAMFPEGVSHDEPGLLPLKTGVARIALEAEERFGPLGVRILPVGLNFEAPDLFRSRVLVQIGEPIEVSAAEAAGDREAVRALTKAVEEGLRAVTLNYESWRQAELLHCAAEVYARPAVEAPLREKLSKQFALKKAFLSGYRELSGRSPELVVDVLDATGRYDRLLRRLRLEDRQVAASYPRGLVVRFLLRKVWSLAFWRPLAFVGLVINWLPYKIPGWVTRRIGLSTNQRATYKVLISLVLFPAFWALTGALVAWKFGGLWGVAALLLGPPAGYLAITYAETWRALRDESRAYLKLKGRRGVADELKRRRLAVRHEVEKLIEIYGSTR